MSIYSKLLSIQQNLVVPKNKHNDFGNFDYRSAEDIIEAVKPHLKEHGLILLLNDKVKLVGEKYYVESIASITDGTETIEVTASAREPQSPKAKMDESQTTGSTSSYARKYALNGLFALDDNADSDTTNKGQKKIPNKEDDKTITKAQKIELTKYGVNLEDVAKYLKVSSVDDIPFEKAKALITKKVKEAANGKK